MISGGAGADILDGGAGTDVVYEAANADFTISATLQMSWTATGTKTTFGVEGFVLIGGASGNKLDASASTVSVRWLGGGGNDTLLGGSKADVLIGGNRAIPLLAQTPSLVARGPTFSTMTQQISALPRLASKFWQTSSRSCLAGLMLYKQQGCSLPFLHPRKISGAEYMDVWWLVGGPPGWGE